MLKLPAIRGQLQLMAVQSNVIRDLCAAYEEACLAVERLQRQNAHGGNSRLLEYETIQTEIENDILHLILQQSRDTSS